MSRKEHILIHRYQLNFGQNKRDFIKVYEGEHAWSRAYEALNLFGGTLDEYKKYDQFDEYEARFEIEHEVASVIDDMSTEAPGSPRWLEPNTDDWLSYKERVLTNIRESLEKL